MKRVAIIGAGASGLMAAVSAKLHHPDWEVSVFEKNAASGKKLLKTGNGRCNFTNTKLSLDNYYSENKAFIFNIIKSFDDKWLVGFFQKELGIVARYKDNLVYPYSLQAKTIRDGLFDKCNKLKVNFALSADVGDIKKGSDGFMVLCDRPYTGFDKVIIATGGLADPKSGSSGEGFLFAKNTGHKIIPTYPALTALCADDKYLKKAFGIRIDGDLTLKTNTNIYKESGNIQITDYGVSGICIMQLSKYAAKALANKENVTLYMDFAPDYNTSDLKNIIDNLYKKNIGLWGLLPDKLVGVITKNDTIRDKDLLVKRIKEYKINIIDTKGYEQAQCTLGGVSLDMMKSTLESMVVPGMYFCGEILDACGDCGGYNLQWAFSTGYIAGTLE